MHRYNLNRWEEEEQEYYRIVDSIERYDQMDPDEIEPDKYEWLMQRQEELRKKGHPEP